MAYDAEARGKSKGLELIYQPIKDSKMCRPLTEFNKPIVLSYTKMKAIVISEMNHEN